MAQRLIAARLGIFGRGIAADVGDTSPHLRILPMVPAKGRIGIPTHALFDS